MTDLTALREVVARCRLSPESVLMGQAADEIETLRSQRDNLAILVRRLVHKCGKCDLSDKANDYLMRNDLAGSPLREEKSYGD